MNPDFALMVPAFNGGVLLEQTLRSCLAANFVVGRVVVVVCDNGSTDGSYEMACQLGAESPGILQVHQNNENLGRIGNWNKCLDLARSLGAKFGTFLMVGDEWLPEVNPLGIITEMESTSAEFALAPYHLVDETGKLKRIGRNFIKGKRRVVDAQSFINVALSEGALCFGPLQANIYRLDSARALKFDTQDPTHTDQRATLVQLGVDAKRILLWEQPIFAWKAHAGRFHMGMDVGKRALEDIQLILSIAKDRALKIDRGRIHVNLFLMIAREWAGKPNGYKKIRESARLFYSLEGGLSWPLVVAQVVRRVVFRRFLT